MGNTVFGVAVDSTDAATLASFWAQVLGRQVAGCATTEHAVVPADADPRTGRGGRSTGFPSRKPARTAST